MHENGILVPDDQIIQHSYFWENSHSPIFFAPNDANDAKVPKVQIPQNWQNCKKCQISIDAFMQFYQFCGICTIGTEKIQLNIYFHTSVS